MSSRVGGGFLCGRFPAFGDMRQLRIIFPFFNVMSEPCAGVQCKEPKLCKADSLGNAECVCPDERDCPMTVHAVCGSDHKTYLNECVMKAKACLREMPVYIVMDGYCGEYWS